MDVIGTFSDEELTEGVVTGVNNETSLGVLRLVKVLGEEIEGTGIDEDVIEGLVKLVNDETPLRLVRLAERLVDEVHGTEYNGLLSEGPIKSVVEIDDGDTTRPELVGVLEIEIDGT